MLSVEEAVNRLTFVPAQLLGIPRRGLLKQGMSADLTIFVAEEVQAMPKEFIEDFPAGASRLIARSIGYKYSIVNGSVILRDGEQTGRRPGRVLRSYES